MNSPEAETSKVCISVEGKRVSFASRVRVREVYLVEEAWLSNIELHYMRENAKLQVKVLRQSNDSIEDDEYTCFHGLRQKVDRDEIRERRDVSFLAVLNEQARQVYKAGHVYDREALSDAYLEATYHAQQIALERGMQTAKEVNCQFATDTESVEESVETCLVKSGEDSFTLLTIQEETEKEEETEIEEEKEETSVGKSEDDSSNSTTLLSINDPTLLTKSARCA